MGLLLKKMGNDPEAGFTHSSKPQLPFQDAELVTETDKPDTPTAERTTPASTKSADNAAPSQEALNKNNKHTTADPTQPETEPTQKTTDSSKSPSPKKVENGTPGFLDWDFSTLKSIRKNYFTRL